jgi:hypothetical protein
VRELRALTPEEFDRAAEKLRNPSPGSRIEAPQKYGTDLTLLIEQLGLTPEERVRKMQTASSVAQQRSCATRAMNTGSPLAIWASTRFRLDGCVARSAS